MATNEEGRDANAHTQVSKEASDEVCRGCTARETALEDARYLICLTEGQVSVCRDSPRLYPYSLGSLRRPTDLKKEMLAIFLYMGLAYT